MRSFDLNEIQTLEKAPTFKSVLNPEFKVFLPHRYARLKAFTKISRHFETETSPFFIYLT